MSVAAVRGVVRYFGSPADPPTDANLVTAFAARRDPVAFAELVRRHGPTVLGACRRVLGHSHDAEDAFQAVFLVLAQKVSGIRPAGAVGGWLYGVAVRTANKAKVAAARRRKREMIAAAAQAVRQSEQPEGVPENTELRSALDTELARLPEALRAAIVLCDLHGKTRAEAAAELGCPEGTVAARLHRGRKRLADVLARRGFAMPAAGLAAVLAPAPVSATLSQSTFALVTGTAAPIVHALAREVLRSMTTTIHSLAVGVLALLAGGLLAAGAMTRSPDPANEPAPLASADAPPAAEPAKPKVSAWKEREAIKLDGWLAGSVAYSPDGKVMYVGGTDGRVHAYDSATHQLLWEYNGERGDFAAVAISPDGKQLAATFKDGVHLLDAATGKADGVVEKKGSEPLAVAFFPGEKVRPRQQMVFGGARGWFLAWVKGPDVSTINFVTKPEGKGPIDRYAVPMVVAPDGSRVFITGPIDRATGKHALWAWSAGSGAGNQLLEGHKATVTGAAWSKDGKTIVTGDADGVVITWDATTFKEKSRVNLGGRVAALAITDDATHVAAAITPDAPAYGQGAYTEEVFVWPAGSPAKEFEPISRQKRSGLFEGGASVAFSPDGKTLAVAFADFNRIRKPMEVTGTVRIFTLAEPEQPKPEPVTWVQQIVISPDGKRYAVIPGGVFDATGKKLYTAPATALGFSADGKKLFAMGDKAVLECDAETGKVLKEHPRPKTDLAWHFVRFSPDGKRYAAHFGFNVRVYDTATGFEPVRLGDQHEPGSGTIFGTAGKDLLWSNDGKQLAAVGVITEVGGKMGLVVWDTATGKRTEVHNATINDGPLSAAFTPDGDRLAIGGKDRVQVWVIRSDAKKNPERTYRPGGPTTAIAYSKDGKLVALGVRVPFLNGADKKPAIIGHKTEVHVYNAVTAEEVKRFDGFEGVNHMAPTKLAVNALAFSADGNRVFAGTGLPPVTPFEADVPRKGEFKVFSLDDKPVPAPEQKWSVGGALGHTSLVNGVAVAPDGKSFAAATEGDVTVWDSAMRRPLWKHESDTLFITVAYSPDGKYIAATRQKSTELFEAKTGKRVPTDPPIPGGRALAFSPDGKFIAVCTGQEVAVRSVADTSKGPTLKCVTDVPEGHFPACLAWSPDGSQLAIPYHEPIDGNYGVDVYDVATWKAKPLVGHAARITAVAWSKDGKVLVTGGPDGLVIGCNPVARTELWREKLTARDGSIPRTNSLAISPADNTIAAAVSLGSGKGAERVVLLDPATGKHVGFAQGGSLPISSVAWAPDGKFLVTGAGSTTFPLKSEGGGEVVVWVPKP